MKHNLRSGLGRFTVIAFCLATMLLVGLVHASDQTYDVVISWRHERILDEPEHLPDKGGTISTARVLYYWNDQYVGYDRDGLAEIYDQLKRFNGKTILWRNRPREKTTRMNDPLSGEIFEHFSNLLRKRDVVFAIEYRDDKRDVVLPPWDNPFRDPQTPPKAKKKTEQGGADQPATAPELKSEGKDKPQPESKVRPQ